MEDLDPRQESAKLAAEKEMDVMVAAERCGKDGEDRADLWPRAPPGQGVAGSGMPLMTYRGGTGASVGALQRLRRGRKVMDEVLKEGVDGRPEKLVRVASWRGRRVAVALVTRVIIGHRGVASARGRRRSVRGRIWKDGAWGHDLCLGPVEDEANPREFLLEDN